jgi:hypothetical protein
VVLHELPFLHVALEEAKEDTACSPGGSTIQAPLHQAEKKPLHIQGALVNLNEQKPSVGKADTKASFIARIGRRVSVESISSCHSERQAEKVLAAEAECRRGEPALAAVAAVLQQVEKAIALPSESHS